MDLTEEQAKLHDTVDITGTVLVVLTIHAIDIGFMILTIVTASTYYCHCSYVCHSCRDYDYFYSSALTITTYLLLRLSLLLLLLLLLSLHHYNFMRGNVAACTRWHIQAMIPARTPTRTSHESTGLCTHLI